MVGRLRKVDAAWCLMHAPCIPADDPAKYNIYKAHVPCMFSQRVVGVSTCGYHKACAYCQTQNVAQGAVFEEHDDCPENKGCVFDSNGRSSVKTGEI